MSVAPFVRPLNKGKPLEKGKDVTAVQRALRAEGSLTRKVASGAYGERTWEAVTKFQKKVRLTPDGDYGKATHAKLARHYDQYGKWLLAEAQDDLKPDPREMVRQTAYWYYGQKWDIQYSQSRPITTVFYGIYPPSLPRYLDCSGFAITCYAANKLAFRLGSENAGGFGNTWSLARHGKSVSVVSLRPGDLVFYGSDCGHVAVFVGNGRVISMGHYPMSLLPVAYRSIWGARSYLP